MQRPVFARRCSLGSKATEFERFKTVKRGNCCQLGVFMRTRLFVCHVSLFLLTFLSFASLADAQRQDGNTVAFEEKGLFRIEVPPDWHILSSSHGDPVAILSIYSPSGNPRAVLLGPNLQLIIERDVDSSPPDEYLRNHQRSARVSIEEELVASGLPARKFTYYVKGAWYSGRTIHQTTFAARDPALACDFVLLGKGEYWVLKLRRPQKIWGRPRSEWPGEQLQAWKEYEQIVQSFQFLEPARSRLMETPPSGTVSAATPRRFYWDGNAGVRLELPEATGFELRGGYGRLGIVGTDINLAVVRAPTEKPFESVKDELIAGIRKSAGVQILSAGSIHLHGVSGTSIEFIEKTEKAGVMRELDVFIDHAGSTYLISSRGSQRDFESHEATLRRLIASTEFVDHP